MQRLTGCLAVAVSLGLGACAVVPPTGPSVMAMPGKDKSFVAFQQDDAECQAYAAQGTGTTPAQAATDSAVGSSVLGTAVGAAAGAALGAAAGNPGAGAAIGGGTGLIVGSAAGSANAGLSSAALQQRYDMRYSQCMTAKGDTVPVATAQAPSVAYPAYPYAYPYPYSYPYPYGYPYPVYAYPRPYLYGPVVGGTIIVGGGHHHHGHW
ncbi:glycine zipper family protein [Azospirillum canadense]|uniref:glycine zipper family protein n=1 Tax=Azospirillum canadense TaxID=403962 RepID=UPI002226BE84|nr:glycine zipper family protein [Azospirillum canadense]MCW2243217.1 hypothetical protein [Azospirillum canadense]